MRWLTITMVAPDFFISCSAAASLASPSVSRLELGSSSTRSLGLPSTARCERDALALAATEIGAGLADVGLVALGQPQDELMAARDGRGRDHLFVAGIAEAGDVVLDDAGEQFDRLRHVADMFADLIAIPPADVDAVES